MARTADIDLLRSIALIGIAVVNIPFLAGPPTLARQVGVDAVAQFLVEWLFQGKFFILFSFVFGWGFAVQIASAERAGQSAMRRLGLRLTGLAVLGIAHGLLVFAGDILLLYALLGTGLLLLRNAPLRVLYRVMAAGIVLGIAGLAVLGAVLPELLASLPPPPASGGYRGGLVDSIAQRTSEWPSAFAFVLLFNGPVAFAAFAAGLAAARLGILERGSPLHARLDRALPLLLAGGLALNAIYAMSMSGLLGEGLAALAGFSLLAVAAPILSAAYLLLILRAARFWGTPEFLARAGRMSLTCYVLEGILAGIVFNGYGFKLYGAVGAAGCLAIALGIAAMTHVIASGWLRIFKEGPLEILLRRWTRLADR
ncbi:uncharacterized protein C8P69_10378 [Phreatobacter oligotrophus]|uniref:DUF418 domain-containing protein n=1 Tax=Phreatobacter oligotrophus TaxID=1122261 RepID=A0A2T4ZE26_9HYPH|nr:uncharacterized protein C8P69_10378 [Phreatobacter oligotrophus]